MSIRIKDADDRRQFSQFDLGLFVFRIDTDTDNAAPYCGEALFLVSTKQNIMEFSNKVLQPF